MALLKLRRLLGTQPLVDLAAESLNQQSPAHADAAMNAPYAERQPHLFQRFMPGKDMVVDAID
ncbi:MAG TPA: hypothetical protein VK638_22195 [Edaphobacter sp.]|nr:hypothetical protein [Edaphobacter sp.]